MTLQEFFQYLDTHPLAILGFFLLIPLTALLAGWMGRGQGQESPWKYLYAVLAYAVCIPGIFAVALGGYLFLFEGGGSIFNVNLLSQVTPVLSMVVTLGIMRRNVSFDQIPGFGKLSSLMMTIGAVFMLMYLLNRTHIIAFVQVPIQFLLLIVVAMLIVLRFSFRQIIS